MVAQKCRWSAPKREVLDLLAHRSRCVPDVDREVSDYMGDGMTQMTDVSLACHPRDVVGLTL